MKSHHLCTCNFGDALQLGHRQGDDNALGSSHPQQPLANQQAGNSHALLTFKRKKEKHTCITNTEKLSLACLCLPMQYYIIFTNCAKEHYCIAYQQLLFLCKFRLKPSTPLIAPPHSCASLISLVNYSSV